MKGDTTPYTHFLMKHSTLTLGDTSVGNFAQFYVETLFCPNPFKSPNYFLALHVPLWNRHNERRLLRFGFDIPENLGNFQNPVRNKATVDAPWVCYIHTHYHLIAIGVSVHQWNYRCSGLLYRIDVGLRRCSLRQDRQS